MIATLNYKYEIKFKSRILSSQLKNSQQEDLCSLNVNTQNKFTRRILTFQVKNSCKKIPATVNCKHQVKIATKVLNSQSRILSENIPAQRIFIHKEESSPEHSAKRFLISDLTRLLPLKISFKSNLLVGIHNQPIRTI